MGTVTTLPRGQALTRQDLDAMPDDGHRYELIDGALIVTPAPSTRHQRISLRLGVILDAACPAGLQVLAAPFDVALAENTVVQPDLLVCHRSDLTERDLPVAPLLAVEILSSSTRHIDLSLKHARFEAAGCPTYWVLDPDGPSLIAWELEAGRYIERGRVTGGEPYDATAPFDVRIVPGRLLD